MPTTPVTFPDIEGTFQLACAEVLDPFFLNGYTGVIRGTVTEILQTEVHYNIDKVQPIRTPRMCIVGTRTVEGFQSKCQDSSGNFVRARKISLRKTAYLSIPRQGPLLVNNGLNNKQFIPTWEYINRVWSQFSLIFHTQQVAFRARGILNPRLAFTPVQGSEKEFLVGIGSFDCNVQFSYREE